MIYLSGQLGFDPVTRQLVSDDVRNQTQQIFRNIRALLHAAGSDMSQIVQCLVLLVDINDFQSMNEIYASAFSSANDYPTRTTFAVKALAANAKIEIQCTAYTHWYSSKEALSNGCERVSFSIKFRLGWFNLLYSTPVSIPVVSLYMTSFYTLVISYLCLLVPFIIVVAVLSSLFILL